MAEDPERQKLIWLEVTNVRRVKDGLEVQVKGDKADREPVWWPVDSESAGYAEDNKADHDAASKAISDGLDKKRIVVAALAVAAQGKLACKSIRIQYAESTSR